MKTADSTVRPLSTLCTFGLCTSYVGIHTNIVLSTLQNTLQNCKPPIHTSSHHVGELYFARGSRFPKRHTLVSFERGLKCEFSIDFKYFRPPSRVTSTKLSQLLEELLGIFQCIITLLCQELKRLHYIHSYPSWFRIDSNDFCLVPEPSWSKWQTISYQRVQMSVTNRVNAFGWCMTRTLTLGSLGNGIPVQGSTRNTFKLPYRWLVISRLLLFFAINDSLVQRKGGPRDSADSTPYSQQFVEWVSGVFVHGRSLFLVQ